ncbi:uncharacterized protein [Henckelia pumila]|uniref:uncharacterized protein isoform X2 n=1 Tax=Henckelia pumila TaxID=405737 RepID=UPI003C6DBE61
MGRKINVPFKIGDLAEAKTFEDGYRGAWFRCKIIEISRRKGSIGIVSEYYDFPEEKLEWVELYQMAPYHVGKTREKKELMLRPPYPPIYRKSQMPLVGEISEVTVIVDDTWKVGDLVDWWKDDCYWSGSITGLFGNCKAMLELKPPPHGEGDTYKVLLKDVRPSLDWSPKQGWTVPPQGEKNGCVCAQIIKPLTQARKARQETMSGHRKDESEDRRTPDIQTQELKARQETMSGHKKDESEDRGTSDIQTHGSEDRRTSEQPQVPQENHGAGGGVVQTQGSEYNRTSEPPQVPHKNHGAGGRVALDSVETDTVEAAIMELEELVNKVKWIKKILEQGISFSDGARPEWEFVDQSPASSAPK